MRKYQHPDKTLIDCAEQIQCIAKTNKDIGPSSNSNSLKSSMYGVIADMHNKNTGNSPCFSAAEAAQTFDKWENDHVISIILAYNSGRGRNGKLVL